MKHVSRYKIFKLLKELDKFKINKSDYAIFGSGPLAIRGLVTPNDLDVIVRPQKYPFDDSPIVIGNIEFSMDFPGVTQDEVNYIIDNSEIINGYPFVRLEYVKRYKEILKRKKDIEQIKIIDDYMSSLDDK